jgi:bifunctional non-homologous end joining protein LigD
VLVKRHPEQLTQEFIKADRGDRILIDTGRNGYGATFAAPYAVRARPGAPVSAPCTWDELARGEVGPQSFALRTTASRVDEVGDLWSDLHDHGFSLREPVEKLRNLLSKGEWLDALDARKRRPVPRKRPAVTAE